MLLPIPFTSLLYLLDKFFPTNVAQRPHTSPPSDNGLTFHLKHIHAATSSAQVYFKDFPLDLLSSNGLAYPPAVPIPTSSMRTLRPPSLHEFTAARHMSRRGQNAILNWAEDEVSGPDVTRRETLLLLAKMTSNSYYVPGHGKWYNLTDEWNLVCCLLVLFYSTCLPRFILHVAGANACIRACPSGGSQMTMASADTCLRQRTTALWSSLSRERPYPSLAVDQR